MKLKKILVSSGLIASVLACSMPAYATDDDNTINEVLSIDDESKTLTTKITYNDSAEFSVTIPKAITLDDSKEFTYSITVKGKVSPETQINIEPIDKIDDYSGVNFYMTKTGDENKQVVASVKQDDTYWLCNEVNKENGTTKTGFISAQGLSVGEWAGNFDLKLSITEHVHDYQDGVCTLCENEVISFNKGSLDEIYTACTQGLAEEYFNVGDERTITLGALSGADNTPDEQEATITIVDIAENGQSITCMFINYDTLAPTHKMNDSGTNEGGWASTSMRSWLNGKEEGDFYSALPSDLQSVIKVHSSSYAETYKATSASYCDDNIWLLSEKEVFGSASRENSGIASKETQLAYFANGGSTRLVSDSWWLRSSCSSNTSGNGRFTSVSSNGSGGYGEANASNYVFPAFCIG
jgi:hypothetical protein